MRALLAIGLLAAGMAVTRPAEAGHHHHNYYPSIGRRASPIIVYDYEPGVVIRAYWLAPWRNRHYFPTGHKIDTTARDEYLPTGTAEPGGRAQEFHRAWSTSWSVAPGDAQGNLLPIENTPPPRAGIAPQNPIAPKVRP